MNKHVIQQTFEYECYEINSKSSYFKPKKKYIEKTFAEEIKDSLNQKNKFINPKFFYDKKGSRLFDKICDLPEYYLTRSEINLLENLGDDLIPFLDEQTRLVELGSGSSLKTKLLLRIFSKIQEKVEYFPIDISNILEESSKQLQEDFDNLHITGIMDTYEAGLELVDSIDDKRNLLAFLGSSFGNFKPDDGFNFLRKINSTMKENDLFLIGLDLIKDNSILEQAYDDKQGVTAEFNLNMLHRINEELDANFDVSKFTHYSKYNEDKQRIEMYLRSTTKQLVTIPKAQLSLNIEEGELIHTEHSHKYSIPQIKELMNQTGFKINHIWKDNQNHYALVLCSKKC